MILRLATSIVLLLPLVAQAAEPKLPDLPIESYTLANGLKVVLHRDPSVPRVSVVVAYHVGSKNEVAGRTGFAHFFEHMMFRGTKNVPNYDIPLQETGTQTNAFTSEDVTVYFETVPAAFLERALYLEAERLAFLPTALDQKKFDTEREVVKNERRQSVENVPYGLSDETILAALYPKGHPYSWSVIGSMKDLDGSSLDDLRRFFAQYYHPGNACLTLAGDFDVAKAKALIETYFSPLAPGPKPSTPEAAPFKVRPTRIRQADSVTLPRIYWTWPTVADGDPDAPALDLLGKILAGGETSRLYRSLVRESRLAKSVSASNDSKEIAGQFNVVATVNEGKALADLEAALAAELQKFQANPPTAAELNRALADEEVSTYSSLTSPLSRAFSLALGSLLKDDPRYYLKELAQYFAVTVADLARVSAKYLTPEKVVLVIEPAKQGEAKATASVAGPVTKGEPEKALVTREPKSGVDWKKMPGPNETPAYAPPKYERRTLSNGVELWFSRWSILPIISAQLVFDAGSADDPAGKDGLARLSATMMNQGTKDKNAVQFAEELEALGASLNLRAGTEESVLGLRVLTRNLAPTLALAGELLTQPRFEPADFEREKSLQLTEILQGPDSPGWIAARVFPALLFGPGHPEGRAGIGRASTVKTITLDEARDFALKSFTTRNARIIVVGDIDLDALVKAIESNLGAWKSKGDLARAKGDPAPAGKPGVIYLVDKPGAVQSIIRVGRRWVDRKDASYAASTVGNHIFGADFLSRLNQNLRERNGFSYGAGSSFNYAREGSVWQVGTSVRTDATAPALKEILAELDGIEGKNPLSPAEIDLARGAIIQSFPESFESPGGIAGAIDEIATYGLPQDYLATYIPEIKAVPTPEVESVMKRLADAKDRTILIVGDRKTIEGPLKALGRGEVKVITLEQAITPK